MCPVYIYGALTKALKRAQLWGQRERERERERERVVFGVLNKLILFSIFSIPMVVRTHCCSSLASPK